MAAPRKYPDELRERAQRLVHEARAQESGLFRLPVEGPCESDLFLLCGKFFTTEEHAPPLRRRWHREQQLVDDAREPGWVREVQRHTAIQRRLEALLADLGQTLEGPDADC